MTPAASRLKRRRNPTQGQTWCLLSHLLHVRNERKSKPMNDLLGGGMIWARGYGKPYMRLAYWLSQVFGIPLKEALQIFYESLDE
jgi:hypothetical protein